MTSANSRAFTPPEGGRRTNSWKAGKVEPVEKAHILVVDDSRETRMLTVAMLEDRFHVQAADSAEAALCLLEKSPFDLVVTDLQMPGMSGLDLARRLGDGGGPPCLILTSFADYHGSDLRASSLPYLAWPFTRKELVARVEHLVVPRAGSAGSAS